MRITFHPVFRPMTRIVLSVKLFLVESPVSVTVVYLGIEIENGGYKSPCIPCGRGPDHAHSAPADVRRKWRLNSSERKPLFRH